MKQTLIAGFFCLFAPVALAGHGAPNFAEVAASGPSTTTSKTAGRIESESGRIEVYAYQVESIETKAVARGIRLRVWEPGYQENPLDRGAAELIDAADAEGLLAAVDKALRFAASAHTGSTEIKYVAKSGLSFSASRQEDGKIGFAIQTSGEGSKSVRLPSAELQHFRDLLMAASKGPVSLDAPADLKLDDHLDVPAQ